MLIEHKAPVSVRIADAKRYLSSTDWYYARLAETGDAVPSEVISKRIAARDYIRSVEDAQ
jgi:hypothetical protein